MAPVSYANELITITMTTHMSMMSSAPVQASEWPSASFFYVFGGAILVALGALCFALYQTRKPDKYVDKK